MEIISPLIIGVCGGSCSGKSTLAQLFMDELGEDACCVLSQDNYYRDFSQQIKRNEEVNLDHPQSLDLELLKEHLIQLKKGQSVYAPFYDFVNRKPLSEGKLFKPRPYILVDGILIFHQASLRECFDYRFFIEVNEVERFSRKQKRDLNHRGRTIEYVQEQFRKYVRPMHDIFVEPSKIYADKILDGCVSPQISLNVMLNKIGVE